ncbi:MAG: hypothetical protein ACI9WU_004592, partial [Myxococcota bacterium]
EVEVTLDIPLTRTVSVVIGQQPLEITGPHRTEVRAHLDLGSDGYIPLAERQVAPDAVDLAFSGLPLSLTDVLYDATYLFHGGAVSDSPDGLPTSDVLRSKLGQLDDGSYLVDDGAGFGRVISGYPGDIYGLWAKTANDVFATTSRGGVIHFDGVGWSAQPVPTGAQLNAIRPDGGGGAWVVGDRGRILHWDGAGWDEPSEPVTARDIRDVHAFGPEAAVAVGAYVILNYENGLWSEVPFGPPKDLRAIWAPGAGDAWAAGADGVLLRRAASTGAWSAVNVPFYEDLNGIWGTADGALVAVGSGGRLVFGAADELEVVQTPTQRTLRDVWGRSDDDIYAVGDGATVVHFDGVDWKVLTENELEVSLRAIDGSGLVGDRVLAMGVHAVHLDPFMRVPSYQSPAPNQLWNQQNVSYSVAPNGAVASFDNVRIFGPDGAMAWGIMAPGHLASYTLPDLGKIEGLPLPPAGQKRFILYRVEHPDFDIDDFDSRVFSLADWRSWVLTSFMFDAEAQGSNVEVDTVPGN